MTSGIMDEFEITNVPVPSQIPQPLDLSQLPSHILRSGAVEALSNQNEDLMARLSVSLKRNSQFEEALSCLENENKSIAHKFEVLKDQFLILQEKDRLAADKIRGFEDQAQAAREQLALLEVQYSELFASDKDRTRQLMTRIEDLSKRITRHIRYRARVRKITRKMRDNLKGLHLKVTRQETDFQELRKTLGEAAERIQNMAKDHGIEQRKLVENYEADLRALRVRIQESERQNQALNEKTKSFEILQDRLIDLENELAGERRQLELYRESKESENASLQASVSEFRSLAKSKTLELEQMSQAFNETRSALNESREELKRSLDQVESLQCLWHDNQDKLEKQDEKVKALQKLNQQLSRTINQQRKELLDLKRQVETQGIEGQKNLKTLEADFSLREQKRIDTLIAEIQSGFSPAKPESLSKSHPSLEIRDSGATGAP